MKIEELQKLEIEKKSLLWYAGDLRDAVMLLEKFDNSSRDEIVDLLNSEATRVIKRAEYLQEEIIKGMKDRESKKL